MYIYILEKFCLLFHLILYTIYIHICVYTKSQRDFCVQCSFLKLFIYGYTEFSLWHVASLVEPRACGILVPLPGIKPTCPALEGRFLSTGPPEKSCVLILFFFLMFAYFCLCQVFVLSLHGLSLVSEWMGYSSAVVFGLLTAVTSPVVEHGVQAVWVSVAAAHRLNSCTSQAPECRLSKMWRAGPVSLHHVGSSQIKDRTSVPCIGSWSLNHWTTSEALLSLKCIFKCSN